ncbi:MAG: NAD(P)H-quinone oxidoreductase subunit I [Elusimicrobia bacterium]|nr:MAG: NAD(P)H-quinone oxidoreductase subunit I [Elusimicrobiota bacterium]
MKKTPGRALFEALRQLFKQPATSAYPFSKAKLQPKFRGRIDFESAKCIGCKMCVRVCPAKALEIVLSADQPAAPAASAGDTMQHGVPVQSQAPAPAKKKFDCVMHLDRCVYCAQCVEVCPKKALISTDDFELAQLDRKVLRRHYK